LKSARNFFRYKKDVKVEDTGVIKYKYGTYSSLKARVSIDPMSHKRFVSIEYKPVYWSEYILIVAPEIVWVDLIIQKPDVLKVKYQNVEIIIEYFNNLVLNHQDLITLKWVKNFRSCLIKLKKHCDRYSYFEEIDAMFDILDLLSSKLSKKEKKEKEDNDHKKDTSEVRESKKLDNDSPYHGGDNNSGEVDHETETSSKDEREGSDGQNEPNSNEGENGSDGPQEGFGDEPSNKNQGDIPSSGEDGFENTYQNPNASGNEHSDSDIDKDLSEKIKEVLNKYKAKQEDLIEKNDCAQQHNGPVIVRNEPVLISDKDAKALDKIIKKLFHAWSNEVDTSKRSRKAYSSKIDERKLVHEIASHRYNLSKIYRKNLDKNIDVYILSIDMSGSCSAVSDHTYGILKSICSINPDVVGIVHANGVIEEIIYKDKIKKLPYRDPKPTHWRDNITKVVSHNFNVKGVIFFGDSDGIELTKTLWDELNSRVIWLDGWCSSHEVRIHERGHIPYAWWAGGHIDKALLGNFDKFKRNVTYVTGIGDADAAAYALRKIHRENL